MIIICYISNFIKICASVQAVRALHRRRTSIVKLFNFIIIIQRALDYRIIHKVFFFDTSHNFLWEKIKTSCKGYSNHQNKETFLFNLYKFRCMQFPLLVICISVWLNDTNNFCVFLICRGMSQSQLHNYNWNMDNSRCCTLSPISETTTHSWKQYPLDGSSGALSSAAVRCVAQLIRSHQYNTVVSTGEYAP